MAAVKNATALRFIEEMTRNADAVQQRVLAEILAQNSETEYLKGCDLGGATDREAFKSKIPMTTYEDIQPLIQRIANGDRSPILSARPISEFLTRYINPKIWHSYIIFSFGIFMFGFDSFIVFAALELQPVREN